MAFLNFIYNYPSISIDKTDLLKRKRVKNRLSKSKKKKLWELYDSEVVVCDAEKDGALDKTVNGEINEDAKLIESIICFLL